MLLRILLNNFIVLFGIIPLIIYLTFFLYETAPISVKIGGSGLALFFVFSAIMGDIQESNKLVKTFLKRSKPHTEHYLKLVAAVLLADNDINAKSQKAVNKFLSSQYRPREASKYIKLLDGELLKTEIIVIDEIPYFLTNFAKRERVDILKSLVSIAVAEKLLSKSELTILEEISKGFKIYTRSFNALLKKFSYKEEWKVDEPDTDDDPNYKWHSWDEWAEKNGHQSKNQLKLAYSCLSLSDSATDAQIKKRYRKLAKKHHPDRIKDKSIEAQNQASEKFDTISDAYTLLKKHRNFK